LGRTNVTTGTRRRFHRRDFEVLPELVHAITIYFTATGSQYNIFAWRIEYLTSMKLLRMAQVPIFLKAQKAFLYVHGFFF
jgi:hypothetical protein